MDRVDLYICRVWDWNTPIEGAAKAVDLERVKELQRRHSGKDTAGLSISESRIA